MYLRKGATSAGIEPRQADGGGDPRVEITPEMMEAGKKAYSEWYDTDDWHDVAVRKIYTAMELARKGLSEPAKKVR